jgi:catechol 2,3-dioxygenase-like lactoylglutathione lyase family enzyme
MSRLFGPLRQNGFVVRDIEAAMRRWTGVLGVGPFFYIEDQPLNDFVYRGVPSRPRFSVALAHSGGVQIELIQQRDDEPSAFRDFLADGEEGLQHVAFWTEEFDRDQRLARDRGLEPLQSGRSGSGGPNERFAYFTAPDARGPVVELSETLGRKAVLFRSVEAAALDWDGREPVRDMRTLLVSS